MDETKFGFGEKITITTSWYKFGDLEGVVKGKIKDLNCYVILFSSGEDVSNYGFPNRHLQLEWGKFSGYDNECIVSGLELKKAQ